MQYLLLIYVSESEDAKRSPAALEALHGEYTSFTQGIVQSGQLKGGERLKPIASASTVRVRNGKTVITEDQAEANAIAARIPGAKHGSIEVRPIWPMS
jgi:hypothetical protein